jgi:hypothetical protein
LATDTGSRLQAFADNVNEQFTTMASTMAGSTEAIKRLYSFVNVLYAAMANIQQIQNYRGTLGVDTWAYIAFIEQVNNGTMMPLIMPNTGTRPPNMTAYTTIDARKLSFKLVSDTACQLTDEEKLARKAYQTAILMDKTIGKALVPIFKHPNTILYTCHVDDIGTITIENLKLFHMPLSLSNGLNKLMNFNGTNLITVADTTPNRASANTLRFFFAASTTANFNSKVLHSLFFFFIQAHLPFLL